MLRISWLSLGRGLKANPIKTVPLGAVFVLVNYGSNIKTMDPIRKKVFWKFLALFLLILALVLGVQFIFQVLK